MPTLRPRAPPADVLLVLGDDADVGVVAAIARRLEPLRVRAVVPYEWAAWRPAQLRAEARAHRLVILHADLIDASPAMVAVAAIRRWLDAVYGAGVVVYPPRATVEWLGSKAYVSALLAVDAGSVPPRTRVARTWREVQAYMAAAPAPAIHLKPTWQSSGRDHFVARAQTPTAEVRAYVCRILRTGRSLILQPHAAPFVETKSAVVDVAAVTLADASETPAQLARRRVLQGLLRSVRAAAAADGVALDWARVDTVALGVGGAAVINELEAIDAFVKPSEEERVGRAIALAAAAALTAATLPAAAPIAAAS